MKETEQVILNTNEIIDEQNNETISNHPYIINEGEHISHTSGNILLEQMNFFKFKTKLNLYINELNSKKVYKFWDAYGLTQYKRGAIETAIQKGICLDYDKLNEDLEDFFDGKIDDFPANIEALRQICEIKLIESRLLGLFETEIREEQSQGSISLLQAITSTTSFIYSMYESGLPQHSELMKNINSEDYFYYLEKGLLNTRLIDMDKDEVLKKYLAMPMDLLNSMLLVADECKLKRNQINELLDNINCYIKELHQHNVDCAKDFKDSLMQINNEYQTYEISTIKKEDDYSIQ